MNLKQDQEKHISGLLATFKANDYAGPSKSWTDPSLAASRASNCNDLAAANTEIEQSESDNVDESAVQLYDYREDHESSFMYEYKQNKLENRHHGTATAGSLHIYIEFAFFSA